jgi:hypothetical protein
MKNIQPGNRKPENWKPENWKDVCRDGDITVVPAAWDMRGNGRKAQYGVNLHGCR